MFVKDRMSTPITTVSAKTAFPDALKLMQEGGFRRLPVVDRKGRLVGIVSERDLLHAAPSAASSLSIWEVQYLLSKLEIETIMTKDVVTVTPDMPVEDAASLMVIKKVGGLPVVDRGKKVVGIITETDIFETFVEMFSAGAAGLRLTLRVPERKGVIARLATTIFELGGSIESVGSFYGEVAGERELVIKVRDVSKDQLVDTLEALGDQVVDAREA